MPKNFTLCPATQAPALVFDTVYHLLQKAQFEVQQCSPFAESCGLIFFADFEKELDWLYVQITEARLRHQRSLVVWGGLTPLPGFQLWRLIEAGANDVIQWQTNLLAADYLLARLKRWLYVDDHLEHPIIRNNMAGECACWRAKLRQLIEIAAFSQEPVLILGESGTGKEMAARLIHHFDIRPYKQDLTLLDCSSIAPDLSGSEFFGHEKGAFTNAVSTRDGAFALADKGTLFLDEIGELPLHLQAELLRVTQEGAYKKLGSNQWQQTSFRLVSATNRNLERQVIDKQFRQDLYYRISTWVVQLPNLSERREDIPMLVQTFLKQIIPDARKRPVIDPLVMAMLCLREYPGNVRELRQVVTRLAGRYVGTGIISLGDLHECDRPGTNHHSTTATGDFTAFVQAAVRNGQSLKSIVQQISEMAKDAAIEHSNGNLQAASALLQVSDRTLQMHLAARK